MRVQPRTGPIDEVLDDLAQRRLAGDRRSIDERAAFDFGFQHSLFGHRGHQAGHGGIVPGVLSVENFPDLADVARARIPEDFEDLQLDGSRIFSFRPGHKCSPW